MAAALIGAAATILAAIIPLAVVLWRTRTTVDVIHHLVNSQRDEQLRYQAELTNLIRHLGGIVPDQDPPSGAP